MAKRRSVVRQRKRKGGFLLGTFVGVVAGAAGGMALLKRADQDELSAVVPEPVAEATGQTIDTARQAQAAVAERTRGGLDAIKERWRTALAEGKVAAAERERELEEQFARETKRLPTKPTGEIDTSAAPP